MKDYCNVFYAFLNDLSLDKQVYSEPADELMASLSRVKTKTENETVKGGRFCYWP